MKKVTLKNNHLLVSILTKGAELCSLFDMRDGAEHIWNADPKFWNRHAPILFPCIGESKDGRINVDGMDYPMGRHGFARHEVFSVINQEESKVTLELKSNKQTLPYYPFEFVFRVTYELVDLSVKQSFEVVNLDTREMGFQLGGHPAFAVPFRKGERHDEYEIWFDRPQTLYRHLLTDSGLYSGKTRLFLEREDHFPLSYQLFNEDALVFKNISSKRIWIQHSNGYKKLEVNYEGFPHLGIWSVPGADYVCIEPWIGCADMVNQPDDFFSKDSLIKLAPNGQFEASFSISLKM